MAGAKDVVASLLVVDRKGEQVVGQPLDNRDVAVAPRTIAFNFLRLQVVDHETSVILVGCDNCCDMRAGQIHGRIFQNLRTEEIHHRDGLIGGNRIGTIQIQFLRLREAGKSEGQRQRAEPGE